MSKKYESSGKRILPHKIARAVAFEIAEAAVRNAQAEGHAGYKFDGESEMRVSKELDSIAVRLSRYANYQEWPEYEKADESRKA